MSRIAIVGSCITRDLWPIRGEVLQDVLYISRTSLPSLFSPPVEDLRPRATPPDGLGRHQHNALVEDLQKTALARLAFFSPTHIIFDLIDERFDLLAVNPGLCLDSWELRASGYLGQAGLRDARRIPRLSAACDRIWRRGAEELAAFIRATPLRSARLILHVSRWACESRAADGSLRPLTGVEVLPGQPARIGEHNALLARYEAELAAILPPLDRIDAGAWRIADENHRWGLSPFHFVPEYYAEIRRQLQALGVEAGLSESPAEPSALGV